MKQPHSPEEIPGTNLTRVPAEFVPQPATSRRLTRRGLLGASAATALAAAIADPQLAEAQKPNTCISSPDPSCTTVPSCPTPTRPAPQPNNYVYSQPEVALAFRNHGFLYELADMDVTPLGAHYLLVHFDVQELSPFNYSIALGGRVQHPRLIPLSELLTREIVNQAVVLECAGTGRSELTPRPVYVPWFKNPIGNYVWTGTPLAPLLEQAGILPDAVEVLFTGWDIGVDLGIEHAFERSLPLADALRPEVMLAWLHNGQPLLPQHGFPVRLIVPSWYGMASVKWLRAITVIDEPFQGMEQFYEYRYKATPADPGLPVREKHVNSVMKPPGIPDLISRWRFIAPGTYTVTGKAWTGTGHITEVDFSFDDGVTWQPTQLHYPFPDSPYAWVTWSTQWTAATRHLLFAVPGDRLIRQCSTARRPVGLE